LSNIGGLCVVVEATFEMDWPPMYPAQGPIAASGPISTLVSVSRALVLFEDHIVKLRPVDSPQRGGFPELSEAASFVQPFWASALFTKYRQNMYLTEEKLTEFKGFLRDYLSLEKPSFVWSAIRGFGIACDMAGELDDLEYRLLDYVRCLEALLGEQGETAHKLALRTSVLVGGTPEERLNTYEFIKAVYDCRSRSAHGEGMPQIKFDRWGGTVRGVGWMEDVDMLHSYCRVCLRRVNDLVLAISKNEELAKKWKEKSDRERKRWVTRLLDYSLLRADLAKMLESFVNRIASIETLWVEYERICESRFSHPLMYEQ
jgi:hypothetical protein